MKEQSSVVGRRSLALDPAAQLVVERLVETGLFGLSEAEVVRRLVSRWILDNRGFLADLGVSLQSICKRVSKGAAR